MNKKQLDYFHADDGRKLNKKLSHARFRYYLKKELIKSFNCKDHGK